MNERILTFLEEYESRVIPLSRKLHLADYNASISGKPEDFRKAADLQLEFTKIFSDKKAFKQLAGFKKENISDPIIKRQIELIYNDYASNQFDEELHKEIIELTAKIEGKFSTFRVKVDEKYYTDNEIDEILITSRNNDWLKKIWEGSKIIGKEVGVDIIQLVKLRNKAAQKIGYEDYYELSLDLSEQNSKDLDALFDQLNELTREIFSSLKNEIDEHLAILYKTDKNNLSPWHYQDKFFQFAPKIDKVDLNKYYKNINVEEIARKYFGTLRLNADDILDNSDLYEKKDKYQHAYCTAIDRSGDIRIVCNIKPTHNWMNTLLHETGHAVYDKHVSPKLPWQLRTHSHIFTTEAVAMLFGKLASNPYWISEMLGIKDFEDKNTIEECLKSLKAEQLVFCRWTMVMYRFEKALYKNPESDLNSLWWQLVEKYQLIKQPENRNEPDWASKIHIALYPVYYHNYMLGELLAAQLQNYISRKVLNDDAVLKQTFINKSEVGEYLQHLFFSYGAVYKWDDLILKSTGEKLTAKYYAQQFLE